MSKYGIDHLWRVTGEEDIEIRGKKQRLYLRTVTAAGDVTRRDHAVAASRLMYARLKDHESPEYSRYFGALSCTPKEDLVEQAVTLKRMVLAQESVREINPVDSPEPSSHPNITEIVEIEEETERIQKDVLAEREKWVQEGLDAYRAQLDGASREYVLSQIEETQLNALLESEFSRAFHDATLFLGVFKDAKRTQKLFASPAEVQEADPSLREQLLSAYTQMDVFTARPDELKN